MDIKIAICDNSAKSCLDIVSLINERMPNAEIKIFNSAISILKTDEFFHIYFLDIKGIKGIEVANVTLHVGIGTFRPVKVENIEEWTDDDIDELETNTFTSNTPSDICINTSEDVYECYKVND